MFIIKIPACFKGDIYITHAVKYIYIYIYTVILKCTESLKRDNTDIFYLRALYKQNI